MALYPFLPKPASVSSPYVIDPLHRFRADSGFEIRRAKASRPRIGYNMEYLGVNTADYRILRDFFQYYRLGLGVFEWTHLTAYDSVTVENTTPVVLTYPYGHGLFDNQSVWITNSPFGGLNTIWTITRIDPYRLTLNGSSSFGLATATTSVYLPYAVGIFPDDTFQSVAKLIGPERNNEGAWSFNITIEEVF